ncbi:SRPBCC family protein [Sinosporangium siamense]|uniref:Coenzyme Q-binding protein COQ10 START domain-containing protein n=1 Tax=Sinosporangium siamense TaxID=1367973 RepID=A0A919RGC4_9ACTN|nr:SRPBCC family protein [Sinosporangium siamense]GII92877.1 hypothetical protein Ssi02_31080 [Sinosporangium siamense]
MTETLKKVIRKPAANLLKREIQSVSQAFVERSLTSLSGKIEDVTERLSDYVAGDSEGGLISAVTGSNKANKADKTDKTGKARGKGIGGLFGKVKDVVTGLGRKGGRGKGEKIKVTNIVESMDVGAPIGIVYNTWTEFEDFPSFMKKVESVEQESDEKLKWRAQVFWSHRNWVSTIKEQIPDERIIWRSDGPKGHVDGSVSFHELAPDLTRIILVLEYHPKGFMEHVGNLWRAPGRRARLEFKHFGRHVMSHTMLRPDDAPEGWRGEIHDGQVTKEPGEEEEEKGPRAEGEEPEEEEAEERAERAEEEPEEEEETGKGRRGRREKAPRAEEHAEEEAEEGEPEEEEAEERSERAGRARPRRREKETVPGPRERASRPVRRRTAGTPRG